MRAGHRWTLDWGDACVSHPFLVLAVALEGQVAWCPDDEESSGDAASTQQRLEMFVDGRVLDWRARRLRLGGW